ncbi:hypothetical protein BX616_004628 [Lobosporangium transversale]|nr:hypothetical protein BX616_004628 [Lobosporangium transversale]
MEARGHANEVKGDLERKESNGQTIEEDLAFEEERTRLITDINLELGQMITNITILQRNLDTIVTIGQEFGQLSELWKNFHDSAFRFEKEEDQEVEEEQTQSREQGYSLESK